MTCDSIEGGPWGVVVVFAAFFIQVLAFGTSQSIGVYNVELLRYFDTGAAAVSLVGSINLGVMLGAGPLSSVLMSRWSHRQVALLGAILTNVGLIFLPFSPNLPYMYIFYGIITGLGESLVYVPSHVLSGMYFAKHRSLATGIATAGSGFGSTIFPIIFYKLIDFYGWRGSLFIVSGLNLHLLILVGLLRPVSKELKKRLATIEAEELGRDLELKEFREIKISSSQINSSEVECTEKTVTDSLIENGDKQPGVKQSSKDRVDDLKQSDVECSELNDTQPGSDKVKDVEGGEGLITDNINEASKKQNNTIETATEVDALVTNTSIPPIALTTWQSVKKHFEHILTIEFIAYWISNICWNAGGGILIIFLPEFMISIGLEKETSSFALTMIGGTSCIGCVIGGLLGNIKCFDRIAVYSVANLLAGILAMCCAQSIFHFVEGQMVLVSFYGFMFGIILGLIVIVTSDLLGIEALGDGFGYLMFANGIGIFSGPPIAGIVSDMTGSLIPGLYVSGCCSILAGLVMVVIPLRRRLTKTTTDRQ